jgi:hypothetical protein
MSHKKHRKHHSCRGLSHSGMGKLFIAGAVGIAVGAGGYYMYLASKTPALTGMGLIDVQRYEVSPWR